MGNDAYNHNCILPDFQSYLRSYYVGKDAFRTHEFFINFWRINIPDKTGRNLNELTFWAIATKHCVAIEQANIGRKSPFEVCLKVYPSRKPYYVDKT